MDLARINYHETHAVSTSSNGSKPPSVALSQLLVSVILADVRAPDKRRLTTFGQELYLRESIHAIEVFGGLAGHKDLRNKIADALSHGSMSTRLRLASKIIQRFFRNPNDKSPAHAFLRLVSGAKSEQLRRDLLYWRTARTDLVISAVAAEIFYPFFVLGILPAGYDESTFRMENTAALFTTDMVITRDLVVNFARRQWDFHSQTSLTLALRIMRQAEILDTISVTIGRRRILGYYLRPHFPAVEAFVYSIYEESMPQRRNILLLDQVQNGNFAKTFLLSRLQADSLLKTAEKNGYVKSISKPGPRRIELAIRNLDALVDKILEE